MEIKLSAYATSYGMGPFHPAISNGKDVYYWPNITHKTEDEAYDWACKALDNAHKAANAVSKEWNVYKVEE